jgi:threonine synthase
MRSDYSHITHLECPECGKIFAANERQTFCTDCRSPIFAKYDLGQLSQTITKETIRNRQPGIWRWAELLPVEKAKFQTTLGEGDTPLLRLKKAAGRAGLAELWVKDESSNPTASFKARGVNVAVSKALELGIDTIVIPSAGNAGGALAAYASRAGIKAYIVMLESSRGFNRMEVLLYGASLELLDGSLADASRKAEELSIKNGWFNLATFKEPYRVEGKKTLGFELAESFDWTLPDVIVFPTGGGTGLVGIWKAFEELSEMGWLKGKLPRMIVVQASGCAPIVEAFTNQQIDTSVWKNGNTIATGLNVASTFAGRRILKILRESGGCAIAVDDSDIIESQQFLAKEEGIFCSPEGAAGLAGINKLVKQGIVNSDEKTIFFNTASGVKYL